MTDHADLIAEADAAMEGVTEGPWVWDKHYDDSHSITSGEKLVALSVDQFYASDDRFPSTGLEDARFIAWCREGVPSLLAALRESDAQLNEARGLLRQWTELEDEVIHDISEASGWEGAHDATLALTRAFLARFPGEDN